MGQLLENTVLGGILILSVAALRRALRGRISPNVILLLWAVCIVRLLTPVGLRSPVSLYALMGDGRGQAPWAYTEAEERKSGDTRIGGSGEVDIIRGTVDASQSDKSPVEHDGPSVKAISSGVYIIVTACAAALCGAEWLDVRRRVRALPKAASEYARAYLPKRAGLRVGSLAGAPMTFGVARPDVVVTPELDGEELFYVLRHEAVHAWRGDNIWHYLAAACLCAHWFNPAVWLMAALIRRDVELSCDRAVVAGAGGDIRADYANAIISMSASPSGAAFASGFAKRKTEERVVNIMKYKKTTIAGIAAAVLLAAAAAALVLTPARAREPEDTEFVYTYERFPGRSDLRYGDIRYHVTGAWVATRESQIPEGKFKPYCSTSATLLKESCSDDPVHQWTEGGTPTFIGSDGSFCDDVYIIFVDVEMTSGGAATYTLYDEETEGVNGYLTDPYLFRGQELLMLCDSGKEEGPMHMVYRPDFFSFYGEGFDAEAVKKGWDYNFADACLAYRLEPGETRTVTLGYIIHPDEEGVLPKPSQFRAQPDIGRGSGSWFEGDMAYLNL